VAEQMMAMRAICLQIVVELNKMRIRYFSALNIITRSQRCERGSAAIEFALIVPVLLLFVVGGLSYGVYFSVANTVQQIAADTARATVAGLSDDERAALATQHASQVGKSFALIDPTRLSVVTKTSSSSPDLYEVVVTYDASRLAIWAFKGLVPLPSQTVVRSAAILRGGY
jgi:Flp pilus assembly protein TadG